MWKFLVIANILIIVIAAMPGALEKSKQSARKMAKSRAGSSVKERFKNEVNIMNIKGRPEIEVIVPVMKMTEIHPDFELAITGEIYNLFLGLPFEEYKHECLSVKSRSWVESLVLDEGVYTGCVIVDDRDPIMTVKDGWGMFEAYLEINFIVEVFHNYIYHGYWKNNVPDGLGHGYVMDEYRRFGEFPPVLVVAKMYSCNFINGNVEFTDLVAKNLDSNSIRSLYEHKWLLYKEGNIRELFPTSY